MDHIFDRRLTNIGRLKTDMELFQPNNLSLLKPEFTTVNDPGLQTEVSAVLSQSYALSTGGALRLKRAVGANIVSQNFLLEIGTERYFLKMRSAKDQNCLLKEAKLAVALAEMGQRVPRVIFTEEGNCLHIGKRSCVVMYSFEEGHYFTGQGAELDSAAEAFGALTRAAQKLFGEAACKREVGGDWFLEELGPLIEDAAANSEPAIARPSREHRNAVLDHVKEIRTRRTEIESCALPMHLDYHPLNLLMKNGEVSCILDFEHLRSYPVIAGLGFAGYKLVRQAMVDKDIRAEEFSRPSLLYRWLEGWRKSFQDLGFSPKELGTGARYHVLFLIHFILNAWLKRGDARFNYDLEKQLGSLYEIEAIVSSY